MATLKNTLANNIKNLIGWRTARKIVVLSVDDYGSIRLHSKQARNRLEQKGIKFNNRFDALDTLETRQDLEMLFEALTSVKDKNGRSAVMTPFALPCNINFEKMAATGNREYHSELLPQTYQKLESFDGDAYSGAWGLWKEGIRNGLLVPQFHGREHINLRVFAEKLKANDETVMKFLENRSYLSALGSTYPTISPMAAFDFWDFEDNERFKPIIEDGLQKFEAVFGNKATNFTPPVYSAHPELYKTLHRHGIDFVDTAMFVKEHQGRGAYKSKINYTGKIAEDDIRLMVRNVVFEPTEERGINWPEFALNQIEAAFRWNKPAIISSHRVNFSGYIDPENRQKGIKALKTLLHEVTKRWPEVEFMAASELGTLIDSE